MAEMVVSRVGASDNPGALQNPKLPQAERDQLLSITRNRYPNELADALELFANFGQKPATDGTPASKSAEQHIDGNVVARQQGVLVKSASVKISRLHPAMEHVIVAVADAARELGLPTPVITSGNDSNHKRGSLHYSWRALDFRGNNNIVSVGRKLESEVAARLGKGYDVIFETFEQAANNHLHVEYDPK